MNSETTRQRDGAPLSDKLLVAITRHLNQDHLEDILACARATAAIDWAVQASLTHLDAAGMNIEVSGCNNVQSLRIDFPEPAKGVLSLQRRLSGLITESRAQLSCPATRDDQ